MSDVSNARSTEPEMDRITLASLAEPRPFGCLERAIAEMNKDFARPSMPLLELSNLVSVSSAKEGQDWPNAGLPGVYVLLTKGQAVLYVGCALNTLHDRLNDYFYANGKPKPNAKAWASDVEFVATIGIPNRNRFEALAIEEFLIERLCPPKNQDGRYRSSLTWQAFQNE